MATAKKKDKDPVDPRRLIEVQLRVPRGISLEDMDWVLARLKADLATRWRDKRNVDSTGGVHVGAEVSVTMTTPPPPALAPSLWPEDDLLPSVRAAYAAISTPEHDDDRTPKPHQKRPRTRRQQGTEAAKQPRAGGRRRG